MLELRRPTEEDLEKAFVCRNYPEIFKWCRQCLPISKEAHLRYWEKVQSDRSIELFSIVADGHWIGIGGLTSIDFINRKAEFSLYIDPVSQKKGLGKKALVKIVEVGFQNLALNRIWGEVFEGNHALKMFQDVGFKFEGRQKEAYFREGRFIDSIIVGMTRNEFEERVLAHDTRYNRSHNITYKYYFSGTDLC